MKIMQMSCKSDNFYIGNTNSLCQSSPNCMTFGMIYMRKNIRNPLASLPLRYDEEKSFLIRCN